MTNSVEERHKDKTGTNESERDRLEPCICNEECARHRRHPESKTITTYNMAKYWGPMVLTEQPGERGLE